MKLNRRKFCQCGCGKLVKNKFVNGHRLRKHPIPVLNHHLCSCGKCDILIASDKKYALHHRPVWNKGLKCEYISLFRRGLLTKTQKKALLCLCGCGNYTKPGNKFILGHNRRNHPIIIPNHHPCECGCGELIASNRRFANYHQRIGTKNTNQSCLLMSEKAMKRMAKQDERDTISDTLKRGYSNGTIISYRKGVTHTDDVKQHLSDIGIQKWRDIIYRQDQLLAIGKGLNLRPNKPETIILDLLNLLFPGEWRYTGDFSFTINGKSPDFTNCNGQKKCIEFNGSYWHQNDIPGQRESIFAEFGYDTLIIWEHELKDIENVKSKIIEFHNKPNPYAAHV